MVTFLSTLSPKLMVTSIESPCKYLRLAHPGRIKNRYVKRFKSNIKKTDRYT